MLPITSIRGIAVPELPRAISPSGGGGDFQNLLESSIAKVEQAHNDAAKAVDQFLSGDGEEIHTVAIAGQRAELSMDLFLQVRNKVVSASRTIHTRSECVTRRCE